MPTTVGTDDSVECPICLDYLDNKTYEVLACGHSICSPCFTLFQEFQATHRQDLACPHCRVVLIKNDPDPEVVRAEIETRHAEAVRAQTTRRCTRGLWTFFTILVIIATVIVNVVFVIRIKAANNAATYDAYSSGFDSNTQQYTLEDFDDDSYHPLH